MIRLGLALGSGGARGLARVGVLAALEEAGLRPANKRPRLATGFFSTTIDREAV